MKLALANGQIQMEKETNNVDDALVRRLTTMMIAYGIFANDGANGDERLLGTKLRTLLSEVFLDDRAVALRWKVSRELMQKMRRLKEGPPYIRLSAGALRYSLWDVMHYEQACRCNGGRGASL